MISSSRVRFGCFVFLIALAMMTLSFTSMISVRAEDSALEATQEECVYVGWTGDVYSWNPLTATMEEDYVFSHMIYSSLFTYDQDWGGPVFDLAMGYFQAVDDQTGKMTTYINITENAYFRSAVDPYSADHLLTAMDVVFTLNLIKDAGGIYSSRLNEVDNVAVISDFSFKLDTPYSKATLIDDLADIPILPEYIWTGIPNPLGSMDPEDLVGSGPFVFDAGLDGAWYKFATAPNYHGEIDYGEIRTVSVDSVLYTVANTPIELAIGLNFGNFDFVVLNREVNVFLNLLGNDATVNVYKAAVAEPGICDIAINAIPESFQTATYGSHHPALNDPFVRQAILMTLDKQFIVDEILCGLATTAVSVIQPGYWQADIENQLPFDPEGARDLLVSHGWSDDVDGDGFLEATADAYGVQMGWVEVGTELSGIRCQAVDSDSSYAMIAMIWEDWASEAGIGFVSEIKSEAIMVNVAWYKADYDIWVWHWRWGPEPLTGTLPVWLTEEIVPGGDNCQMPMGPWWYDKTNYTLAPSEWGLTGPYSAYDQNYSLAMHTLDVDERKAIVDKLQQWIYDSYTETPPYYDLGLYGYTDERFDNWGDITQHSGLNVMSGLPWIWFNVKPVSNRAPVILVGLEGTYTGLVGEEIVFSITVFDPEGDPLNISFDFGDGTGVWTYIQDGTSDPIEEVQSNSYELPGIYDLVVTITDDYVDPESGPRDPIVLHSTVIVLDEIDAAPMIVAFEADPASSAGVGDETVWSLSVLDDGAAGIGMTITFDWDDGTYDVYSLVLLPPNVVVNMAVNHTWYETGIYDVVVSVWDGYGLPTGSHNVTMGIMYEIITNSPPFADFGIYPAIGTTDTVFVLDPSWSFDNEDPYTALKGRWDYESDGVWDTPYDYLDLEYVQYSTIGSREVTLEVMDTEGLTSTINRTIIVDDEPPVAEAGPDASIVAGMRHIFDGTGSSDDLKIVSYRWSFVYEGHTQYLYGATPSFMFSVAGEYTVRLNVSDAAGRISTDTMTLTVTGVVELTSYSGSPRDSVRSWGIQPSQSGRWNAWIENHGLKSLTIEIFEVLGDQQRLVSDMKIRFQEYDAYPSGIVWTPAVPLNEGRSYVIVVSPQGTDGTYAVINQQFLAY